MRFVIPLFFVFNFIFLAGGAAQNADSLRLLSPNGNLQFSISIGDQGGVKNVPVYAISYKNQPVILPSALGLKTNPSGFRNSDWYKELKIVRTQKRNQNTNWTPPYGEQNTYKDHFNELIVTLQSTNEKRKSSLQLIVRAYDEGVAFRYFFPEELSTQILEFSEEQTFFSLPPNTLAWYTPRAQEEYKKVPLKDWTNAAELPVTLELTNGLYASIAQAEQVNYPRIRLQTTAETNVLKSQLFGDVTETSPYATPWRVVLVAEKPGALLENNFLILNLNPASKILNTDWIKPGQVMRETTLSTKGAKEVVDFAVQQQIDYLHFDAGWYGYEYEVASDATTVTVDPRRNPKGDLDLPEAIRYAKSKGKRVILYVNHRALEQQLDSILPLYKSWGVDGIKFGFVHTGSHRWTAWLHEAVKKAANYQLVIDIHDEYRPTGFSRTYPNLLTQEGVLGNEGFPDATHNTILPFTRYIAGAGDYTFCFNTDIIRKDRNKTTQTHQLALPVICYSPLQFVFWYGKPFQYTNTEEFEFWKGLPTTWDETRVTDGKPGEFVSIARRKKNDWYLGYITNVEARQAVIKLDFLSPGKNYKATIYEDDGTGKVKKREQKVSAKTVLTSSVRPSGGIAIALKE